MADPARGDKEGRGAREPLLPPGLNPEPGNPSPHRGPQLAVDVLPVERKEDGRTGCRTEPSQGRTRGPTCHTAHAPCCPAPTGRFPPCPSWGPHPGHLQPGHLPPLPLRPSVSSLNARCPPLSPHQLPRPTRAGSASACPSAREPAPSPLPGSCHGLLQGTRSSRASLRCRYTGRRRLPSCSA